jgi:hypothetical protein
MVTHWQTVLRVRFEYIRSMAKACGTPLPTRTLLLRWVVVVSIEEVGPRRSRSNYYFSCISKGLMPVLFGILNQISYALYISSWNLVTLLQTRG